MKHTAILFSLFFALIFQTACERKQEIRPEILKAEALMDSLPEEAKRILVAEAPHMGNATEGERMKFALLKNKAEDKLYQTHTNDSMMKVVLEYYKKNGTLEERMEAYNQLAGVYRDKHDAPRAIACYTQAMIIGEGHPAPAHREILGRIYAELAWLLDNQRNTRQALELARKKSRLYGDSDYYSLHELGAAFRYDGQRDSAIHFLKAARMALARQQRVDTAEMLTIYGSGLATGIKMEDSAAVRECYEKLRFFRNDALPALALVGKSYYFEGINEDSFRVSLEAAYRKDSVIERRMGHATRLSHYYYKKGNLKKAMAYALARDSMYDEFSKELEYQQAANAYNRYLYERDEQQEQEMREARITAERNFFALLAFFAAFAAFGYNAYRFYRNRNRELAETAERLTVDRDALQERLRHSIEQSTKVNGEQLRAQLHQLAEKRQKEAVITQEMLDQVIAFVAAEYPGFSTSIAAHRGALKNSDLMILYLRKIGMNQSETARLLGRTRSTICHRLTALAAEFGDVAAGIEEQQQEIPADGKASGD